jgi:O-antigen ligase
MLLWRPFRRFAALASAALIVLLVSGFNPAARVLNLHDAINRIAELGNSSSQPVYLREQVYETAPRIALDHPLFGVGALQFPDVAPRYGLTNSAFTEHEVGNPHDIYLHIATNLGFVGLFSLGWLAIALVRSLGIACRTLRGQAQAMAFALAGAFLAMAFAGLTNDFINADPIMGALFMLVGCVSVLGDKRRDHGPLPTPPLTHNKC